MTIIMQRMDRNYTVNVSKDTKMARTSTSKTTTTPSIPDTKPKKKKEVRDIEKEREV